MTERDLAKLLRMEEFMALTGMSRAKAYAMVAAGDIPSIRMGRSVRVPLAGLVSFIQRNTTGGSEEAA